MPPRSEPVDETTNDVIPIVLGEVEVAAGSTSQPVDETTDDVIPIVLGDVEVAAGSTSQPVDETTDHVIPMRFGQGEGAANNYYSQSDSDSYLDYESSVENYIEFVRNSWCITGCTALGYWDGDGPQLNGITVYCPKGVIYLNYTLPEKDKHLEENIIQDLCHLPSNSYSILTDGSIDFDTPGLPSDFAKAKCNVCLHSIILSVLNKMCEKCRWLQDLLPIAKEIVGENYFSVPVETSENPFFHLQQVIKHKTTILAHSSTLVDQLDDGFWENGKEVLDAIRPLVQILHVFETFVPNIGYLYQALEKAEESINLLPSKFDQLQESFKVLKNFSITNMHYAAACLNPAFMFDNTTICHDKLVQGLYYMKQYLVAEFEKKDFTDQWWVYVKKDSSFFTELAKAKLKELHPVQWWENFGVCFPVLKRYAIQLLSQQSNCLAHTLLHKNKFKRLENKIEKNGKLMQDFHFGEDIFKPVDLSTIDTPLY